MKTWKTFMLLAMGAVIITITQCKPTEGEPEEDTERTDSVIIAGKTVSAAKHRTSLKFHEMSISRNTIDKLLDRNDFSSLYFVVSQNNVRKPRYVRLVAYALDTSGNFIIGPDNALLKVEINVRVGSKPIVFEKNTSLEIGNMYLAKSYLQKLPTIYPDYKALNFKPQVSSPLGYELSADANMLSDCTLHPSPPAKPGTSSCQ